ncbi:Ribosome biogenesis protein tsr1-like protein [Smittium culicis]|uniref:Ribosome biogenesis protein tsr1-like protein n=1 Tax=Smittium culicis TaxID=133412 RepID=A0A1R1XX97_9FUNG|nr:Ribosome biogenesis protein tsr1-like protein [Smittium culicis]
MAKDKSFHHRASLKQTNKPFKSRHATKSDLRDKSKGKTQRTSVKGKVLRKQSRLDRKNALKIEQRKKREDYANIKRLFTGRSKVPKTVSFVPLCKNVDVSQIISSFFTCSGLEAPSLNKSNSIHSIDIANFKQEFRLVELSRNFQEILEAAKVSDYLVLVMSALEDVDEFGNSILTAIQSQGSPSVIAAVQHSNSTPAIIKNLSSVKKSLLSFINFYFPSVSQVLSCDTDSDNSTIIRNIANTIPESIVWRDTRPYIVAENLEFLSYDSNETGLSKGDLEITGIVRGTNLDPNRLIYIPGHGNYQIKLISSSNNIPSSDRASKMQKSDETSMDISTENLDDAIISVPDPEKVDSLISSNIPDTTNDEQTWPEEEEMETWKGNN